jgi:hypothetical protein
MEDTIKEFLFSGEYSRYDVIEPSLNSWGTFYIIIMEHQSSYRFYNTSHYEMATVLLIQNGSYFLI